LRCSATLLNFNNTTGATEHVAAAALRDTTTIAGAHTTKLYDLYEKKDVVPISIFWRV
jgi:solute carrier family 15 (peptide/histidine transporter), member 3/4